VILKHLHTQNTQDLVHTQASAIVKLHDFCSWLRIAPPVLENGTTGRVLEANPLPHL